MAGYRIGEKVYVSAGSVVTKDVPDFTVVGNVPAKAIRKIDVSKGKAVSDIKQAANVIRL